MIIGKKLIVPAVLLIASAALSLAWIYQVDPAICNGCGRCVPYCTTGALSMSGANAVIDPDLCDGCGDCVPHCIRGAIYKTWYEGTGGSGSTSSPVLFPNPASTSVSISCLQEGETVELVDISGRIRLVSASGPSGELELNVSSLPPGIFIVRIGERSAVPLMIR